MGNKLLKILKTNTTIAAKDISTSKDSPSIVKAIAVNMLVKKPETKILMSYFF